MKRYIEKGIGMEKKGKMRERERDREILLLIIVVVCGRILTGKQLTCVPQALAGN